MSLTSIDFIDIFGPKSSRGKRYMAALNKVLIGTGLLPPDVEKIDLRGWSGASSPGRVPYRNSFIQVVGKRRVRVPMDGIAHGMQSTLAWIADLVGQVMYETEANVEAADLEGLVLVDEIDVFLSPAWQVRLIPALRKTFPRLQFIVTAHNPGILSAFAPDEVVRLKVDRVTGLVKRFAPDEHTGTLEPVDSPGDVEAQPDPRELSGSELYENYFELSMGPLNPVGAKRRELAALETVPWRTPTQEHRLVELRAELGAPSREERDEPHEEVE
ncbi:MAG: AAA family ATPase [Alphaproteobacteria bacterium]|nr:AAA family ATPase [Alphaproteobacteria bacterium]